MDAGKKMTSLEEFSNLQNIVKQSVDGIFDILKNNPSSTKNVENHNKRKKIDFHPNLNKKFDVIEEKEEEYFGKRNSNNKNPSIEEINVTPVKKVIRKNNLLYSGKNKNNINTSNNLDTQQSQTDDKEKDKDKDFTFANLFKAANNNNNVTSNNPTTPKKDAYNFKERKNKLLKDGNDRLSNAISISQNEKDMNDINQVIKGAVKNIDNLAFKGLTPNKLNEIKAEPKANNLTPNLVSSNEKKFSKQITEHKAKEVGESILNRKNSKEKEKNEKYRNVTPPPQITQNNGRVHKPTVAVKFKKLVTLFNLTYYSFFRKSKQQICLRKLRIRSKNP